METYNTPGFTAFLSRMYAASKEAGYDGQLVKGYICNLVIKQFLDKGEKALASSSIKAYISYLAEEYKNTGVNTLLPDEIAALPMECSVSTSVGWSIKGPYNHVHVSFSQSSPTRGDLLTGVDIVRSNKHDMFSMTTKSFVPHIVDPKSNFETDGIIYPEDQDHLKQMVKFNNELTAACGFTSLGNTGFTDKLADFGIRFFVDTGSEWQFYPVPFNDKAVFGQGQYMINDIVVHPTVFAYDTKNVKGEVSREQQRVALFDLLYEDTLESFGKSGLDVVEKKRIVNCYLDYDRAVHLKR